jgi:hypothetical protein
VTTKSALRVLTWPVHGNYMHYLSLAMGSRATAPVTFYVPKRADPSGGYGGRNCGMPLLDNVVEVPAEAVPDMELDAVLYQARQHYADDHFGLRRRPRLPRLYVEHDPPRETPTEALHPAAGDPDLWLYHVTHYNALMWNSGRAHTGVIEHGVAVPNPGSYTGGLERGITAINQLHQRGRRLGADIFAAVQHQHDVPLDLVGLESQELGGLGPIHGPDLPNLMASYRFYFYPVRYTSLSLSLIEAMMVGLPPVALATTELPSVIQSNVTGFLSCDVRNLVEHMYLFLNNPDLAHSVGRAAARMALERFHIERFGRDWLSAFERAVA